MKVAGSTEDMISTKGHRRACYTIQMDGFEGSRYIDVMMSDSGLAYVMENEDGTAVYGPDGTTYAGVIYDELQALQLARETFEKEYGPSAHKSICGGDAQ